MAGTLTKKPVKVASKPTIDLEADDWETIDDPKQAEKIKKELAKEKDEEEEIPILNRSAIDQEAIKLKEERSLPPVPGKR